jgi:hypothetical protein
MLRSGSGQMAENRMASVAKVIDSIPIDLRKRLDEDADQAARQKDRKCAEILRQLAAYDGKNAPEFARDIGAEPCTMRYDSARELMELVVIAETEKAHRRK